MFNQKYILITKQKMTIFCPCSHFFNLFSFKYMIINALDKLKVKILKLLNIFFSK